MSAVDRLRRVAKTLGIISEATEIAQRVEEKDRRARREWAEALAHDAEEKIRTGVEAGDEELAEEGLEDMRGARDVLSGEASLLRALGLRSDGRDIQDLREGSEEN